MGGDRQKFCKTVAEHSRDRENVDIGQHRIAGGHCGDKIVGGAALRWAESHEESV